MALGATRFLTAQWLNLAVLNFEIDPRVLRPLVPEGVELDKWEGRALVSLVGFLFRDARVCGLAIPFHRTFAEVNLRFYVRRRTPAGWRLGVTFIKEFAPRRAVAWIARRFFGENYTTVAMRHRLEISDAVSEGLEASRRASYAWWLGGREHLLDVATSGPPHLPREGSQEQFVIERCWGYSGGAGRRTLEYRVEHRRWTLRTARQARFDADVAALYGPRFVAALSAPPCSAFLLDGSSVTVFKPDRVMHRDAQAKQRHGQFVGSISKGSGSAVRWK